MQNFIPCYEKNRTADKRFRVCFLIRNLGIKDREILMTAAYQDQDWAESAKTDESLNEAKKQTN